MCAFTTTTLWWSLEKYEPAYHRDLIANRQPRSYWKLHTFRSEDRVFALSKIFPKGPKIVSTKGELMQMNYRKLNSTIHTFHFGRNTLTISIKPAHQLYLLLFDVRQLLCGRCWYFFRIHKAPIIGGMLITKPNPQNLQPAKYHQTYQIDANEHSK